MLLLFMWGVSMHVWRRAGIDFIKLLQLEEVLDLMINEATPHVLCGYLYELASLYMTFYEACPVLKEGVEPSVRDSRLVLCNLVADTLKTGLDLLGIEVMEQM